MISIDMTYPWFCCQNLEPLTMRRLTISETALFLLLSFIQAADIFINKSLKATSEVIAGHTALLSAPAVLLQWSLVV